MTHLFEKVFALNRAKQQEAARKRQQRVGGAPVRKKKKRKAETFIEFKRKQQPARLARTKRLLQRFRRKT